MDYKPQCKETGKKQGDHRFLLEQSGEKMLFVIGLNPSTADETKPDPTVKQVMKFADGNGYDGFAMLNLSSERQTLRKKLSPTLDETMHDRNLTAMRDLAAKYPQSDVLVAFGDGIGVKPYLKRCLRDIYETLRPHTAKWLCIGELTQQGNPRHPLHSLKTLPLNMFDVEIYLRKHKIQ